MDEGPTPTPRHGNEMSAILWGSVLCCGDSEEGASGADRGLEELPGRGEALRRGSHAHEEGVIKG